MNGQSQWTQWQWAIYIACLLMYGILSAVQGDWLTYFEYWTGN